LVKVQTLKRRNPGCSSLKILFNKKENPKIPEFPDFRNSVKMYISSPSSLVSIHVSAEMQGVPVSLMKVPQLLALPKLRSLQISRDKLQNCYLTN
jgi:hypothetical protein